MKLIALSSWWIPAWRATLGVLRVSWALNHRADYCLAGRAEAIDAGCSDFCKRGKFWPYPISWTIPGEPLTSVGWGVGLVALGILLVQMVRLEQRTNQHWGKLMAGLNGRSATVC